MKCLIFLRAKQSHTFKDFYLISRAIESYKINSVDLFFKMKKKENENEIKYNKKNQNKIDMKQSPYSGK